MPLPALHRRNQRAVDKTRMAPPICHCEEAAGRRGALSAKREEVPLGCNLGEAVAISPMAFLLSGRVLRDCHVASLLAMTRQGGTAMGTVQRTELAVLLPLRGRAGHAPPLQGQCGLNDGRRMIHSSFFILQYSLFIISSIPLRGMANHMTKRPEIPCLSCKFPQSRRICH